jgi:hypothetical protein
MTVTVGKEALPTGCGTQVENTRRVRGQEASLKDTGEVEAVVPSGVVIRVASGAQGIRGKVV